LAGGGKLTRGAEGKSKRKYRAILSSFGDKGEERSSFPTSNNSGFESVQENTLRENDGEQKSLEVVQLKSGALVGEQS